METTIKDYGFLQTFPGELRNHIYEHVFTNQCILGSTESTSGGDWRQKRSKKHPRGFFAGRIDMSLVRTCRQIYNETRTFVLSMNDFTVGELSLTRLPPRSTRKKGASGAVIFFNEFMNDIRIEDFTRLTMAIGDFTKDFAEFWKMFGPTSGAHLKKLTLKTHTLQEVFDRNVYSPHLCNQLGPCISKINQLRGVDSIFVEVLDWNYSGMTEGPDNIRIIQDLDAHPTDSRHYHVEQRRFVRSGGERGVRSRETCVHLAKVPGCLTTSDTPLEGHHGGFEIFLRNGRWKYPGGKNFVNPHEHGVLMDIFFESTRHDQSHGGKPNARQQAQRQAHLSLQIQQCEEIRAFKETLTPTLVKLRGSSRTPQPVLSGDNEYYLFSIPEMPQPRIAGPVERDSEEDAVQTEESDEDDVIIPGRKRTPYVEMEESDEDDVVTPARKRARTRRLCPWRN